MGLGAYLLAGALQGAGNGIAEQGRATATERRDRALEELRAQKQENNTRLAGQIQADNQAADDVRKDQFDARHVQRTTAGTIIINKAQGQTQITVDAAKTLNDKSLAKFNSGLRISEGAAADARDVAAQATQAATEIDHYETLESGQVVGITKNGLTIAPKVRNSRTGQVIPVYAKDKKTGDDSGPLSVGGRGLGSSVAPPRDNPVAPPPPVNPDDFGASPGIGFGSSSDPIAATARGGVTRLVGSEAEINAAYEALAPGARFIGPDGKTRTKRSR